MASSSLIDHVAALEDLRQVWTVLFPLPEVLVLCGTQTEADVSRLGHRLPRSLASAISLIVLQAISLGSPQPSSAIQDRAA